MNNRILKICYVVLLTAILVCVILIAVQDIRLGLHPTYQKAFLVLYAVLALYALWRIIRLIKEIIKK